MTDQAATEAAALEAKRQAYLAGIADAALAEEAAAEEAREAIAKAEAEALEHRRRLLARGLEAEERRLEHVAGFESHIREAVNELHLAIEAGMTVLAIPGTLMNMSKTAFLTRVSMWLAAQLYSVSQTSQFGRMTIRYTGRPKTTDSLVESERALVSPLLNSFTGGKPNGHATSQD